MAMRSPLRAIVIGAGSVVQEKHREAYEAWGQRIVPWVICDPSTENRGRAGKLFGVPSERQVRTMEEAARFKEDIDVAVVATPVKYHKPCVCFACEMGWDVLCEKPLALDVGELDAMLEKARTANVRFGVIHNFYYMHVTGECRMLVDQGVLGEVKLVRCESHSKPWSADAWRGSKELGGHGHFFDCLYHEVYLARRAVGSPVARVSAQVGNLVHKDISVEDTVLCALEFANGGMAVFQDSKAFEGRGASIFETHGDKGSIIRNLPLQADWRFLYLGKESESVTVSRHPRCSTHGTRGVFEDFLASVENDTPLPYHIAAAGDGCDNLLILKAAYRSGESRRTVELA